MSLDLYSYQRDFARGFKKTKEVYEMPDEQALACLAEKVSPEYAEFIREEGFCQYKDGLFSTINPLKYLPVMEAYKVHPNAFVPVIKSAFGDLICFGYFTTYIWHVSFNGRYTIGGDIKWLYISRIKESGFQKDFLAKKTLFKKALTKYGKLSPEQSYGFSPLVPKGGTETLENITIVNTLDYLKELGPCF